MDAKPGSPYPWWSMLWFVGLLPWSLVWRPCWAIALKRIGRAFRNREHHWHLIVFIHVKFLANGLRGRVAHRTSLQKRERGTKQQKQQNQHHQGSAQPGLSQPLRQ